MSFGIYKRRNSIEFHLRGNGGSGPPQEGERLSIEEDEYIYSSWPKIVPFFFLSDRKSTHGIY